MYPTSTVRWDGIDVSVDLLWKFACDFVDFSVLAVQSLCRGSYLLYLL